MKGLFSQYLNHIHHLAPPILQATHTRFSLICSFNLLWIASLACFRSQVAGEIQIFSRSLMGTEVSIKVDSEPGSPLKNAVDAAYQEGDRLNMIFSDYEQQSELSKFSRSSISGASVTLSPELFTVLSYARMLSISTDGAFDCTLGPLSRLWRIARFQKRLPAKAKLSSARLRVGHHNLLLEEKDRSGKLLLPGMVLDLGGIAKGYVADRMMEVLRKNGFHRCLIDAGGDLTIGSPPLERKGWRVEIGGRKHPDFPVLELRDCAVATSGDLEQFMEVEGMRYSHLIDPSTGMGLTNVSQATVISPTGMEADAMASAALVMGFDRAQSFFAKEQRHALYYLSLENGEGKLRFWKPDP